MRFVSSDSAGRMLIISRHAYGSKRAIALDFERAPKDGDGAWYCRTYYLLGTSGAYMLAFGVRNITVAQRDAVFGDYDRMAKSFVFADL